MQLKTTLTLSTTNLDGHATDALVLIIAGTSLPDASNPAIAALAGDAIRMGDFAMKVGSAVTLPRPAGLKAARLMLVASGTSLAAARSAMNIAFGELKTRGVATASVLLSGFAPNLTESLAEQTVLAALDALYVYRETKPSAAPKAKLAQITLLIGKDEAKAAKAGLKRGHAIGAGIGLARECSNLPPNIATPAYLANQATALGRAHGLKVEVMDERAIEKLGMGSFLAVAKGSDTPAKFVVMRYQGAATNQAPLALIGKGITFDSGGISLKPGAGMDEMKFDMGGAASVLGTMLAVAELQPRINLVGIVVACENMPSGRALKPGDVVTSMSGQTIEILNTDAEGRLVLCDALTYAERFKPAAVIDVATLTGACVIALGDVRSGMYASDDDLAFALTLAGDAALDPCWRMPLDDEYAVGLKTNFADVANVAGREAGSVIAAKFLQRFASKYRWGHLDIAGTAWKSGAAKGGTGRPVGLLTHFILNQAKAS